MNNKKKEEKGKEEKGKEEKGKEEKGKEEMTRCDNCDEQIIYSINGYYI